MKVIITADDFTVPAGTVLDVGPEVPRAFEGKCQVYVEPVKRDPLDHDGDGRKGGSVKRDRA